MLGFDHNGFLESGAEAPQRLDKLADIEPINVAHPVVSPNPAISDMKLDKRHSRVRGVDPGQRLGPVGEYVSDTAGLQNDQLLVGIDRDPYGPVERILNEQTAFLLSNSVSINDISNALPRLDKVTSCSLMKGDLASGFGFVLEFITYSFV